MAKSNSSAEQLDIAKNLLAVTQQMAAAVDAVNKKQMDQVQIMNQIQDAMKAMDTKGLIASVDAATKAINELTTKLSNLGKTSQQALGDMSGQAKQAGTSVTAMATAVNQAGAAANNTANSAAKLTAAVQDNTKKTDKAAKTWSDFSKELKERFPKSAIFAAGALSSLSSSFGAVKASISFAIGAFKDVVDGILEIGKAIISLPFEFLDTLVGKANALASGTNEWFEAVQEVKDAYGSVETTASSALISMAKNSQSLADTGVNARRVWGSLGAQLKEFNELSKGMGALFDSFAGEFAKTGKQLPAFAKGLGLGAEEMRSLASHARSTGISMTSLSITFTKQSLALSKQFGVSAKNISKDMAKALGDVKHFGGATVKQIASASVYARKLGLELDKITGTLDAFETFEGAADNASKLSQAFGVTVDAFKMMEAQDSAQQVEMLRKSFAAAGKDASSFNRQQLSLLASATGLDEAVAKQAFSLKNQGVSLDKINEKSNEAEKRQIDQTKALRELADAMKLVSQSGSSEGGFLDKFLQGVTQGFERTTEFRGLMRNMIGTFHVLRGEGRRLGDAIMHSFPGVKMFFEGLKEIFDPKKFRKLAGGIVNELITFFKEFMGGKYSFKQLMEKITGPGGVFDKFMDAQGGAGKKVVEGFKTMWTFVTKVTSEAIRWLSEKVASGIKYIGRLISGKEKLTDSGAGSFLADSLGPIWESLKDAWSNIKPVLLETLSELGDTIWNWAKEKLLPMLGDIAPYVIAAIFGGAALKGLLSVATTAFGTMLAQKLTGVISGLGKQVQGAAETAGKAAAATADKVVDAAGSPAAGMAKKLAEEADSMDDAISKQRAVLEEAKKNQKNYLDTSGVGGKSKLAGKDVTKIVGHGNAVAEAQGKLSELEGKKSALEQLKQASASVPTEAVDKSGELMESSNKVMDTEKKSKWGVKEAKELGLKIAAIGAALAVGGIILFGAVVAMTHIMAMADKEQLTATLITLATIVLLAVPLMAALKLAEKQDPGKMLKAAGSMALAMLAMGGVAVGLVYLTQKAGKADWNAIGQVLAVMAGLVLLSIPLLAAMWLASKIDPISVAVGAAAIALGVAAMAFTALGVVEILSGLNPQDVESAAKMLDSISTAFLMMVPILLGAAVIGTAIIASLGIGAILMTKGMETMAEGVMIVATTAVDIVKKLKESNIDSGIGPAIDSFMKVMEVVVKMFDGIGGMFETLLEQDFKKGETAASRLDAGGRFIKSLIGEAGKGTGIIGIAETLLNAARSVKTEDLGPSAEVFTNLLAAVPGILTGLTPSEAFYKACEELEDEEEIAAMAAAAGAMTAAITTSMTTLINTLSAEIKKILKLDLPDPEKAKGVGAILSGLGSIMQSMMPDPKLMEAFRFKTDGGMLGASMEGINFAALGTFFTTYLGSLKDTLPALSSGIITSLVNAVAGIPVDQIGKLAGIGTILGALGELISSLSEAQKNNPIKMQEVKVGPLKMLLPVATTIADVVGSLKSLGPVTGSLIEGVKTLVTGMPTGTNADVFEKQVKMVVSLFSLLKSIPELAKAVKELDQAPGAKEGDLPKTMKFNLAGAIGRITEVLNFMVVGTNGGYLPSLMASVRDVYKYLTQRGEGTTLSKVAEVVTAFFENLKKLSESLGALKQFGATGGGEEAANKMLKLWGLSGVKSPIETAMESLKTVLGQIAPYIPDIKGSIMTIDSALGTFNSDKTVGKLTGFVTSLSGLGNTFDDLIGANIPQGALITGKFSEISQALGSIASGFGKTPEGFVGPVQGVNLSQVQASLANVDTQTLGIVAKQFSGLATILSSIETSFAQVTGVVQTEGITNSLNALAGAVEHINNLNDRIANLTSGKALNIKTGLRNLASGLGIGGKNDITVKNKEVVISMTVNIEMKASEVEQAVLLRKTSIIRDRLDFATHNNVGQKGTAPLPTDPKGAVAFPLVTTGGK